MSLGKRLFIGGDTGIDGTENFTPKLYTGNGTAGHSITGVGFQPDLVWIKSRGDASSNFLFDVVRGTSNWLSSDLNLGQNSASGVTSFDSDGFTLGNNGAMNSNSQNYVAWCFKGGGNSNTFNIDGTGYSTASAAGLDTGLLNPTGASVNTAAGFSILKWTNNGATRTVAHGLNSIPELIIFKRTDTSQNWFVETDVIDGSYDYLVLNDGSSAKVDGSGAWSTRATSSTITSFTSTTNSEYIAYCFHSVTGYQKIGSYTGGGSSGKTVTTGFRPRWVMIRRTDVGNYWVIIDSVRDTSDPYGQILYANVSDAEASGGATTSISFSDTGFSMSTSAVGSSINASGGTYIYIAIA